MPKLYKFEEIEKLEENVKKKRIVVEESITKKEFFTLEDKERELENAKRGATYIFWLNETTSIDGSVGGNISRYVNHSCNPNLIYVVKNERVFLYAKSNIKKDEELTFDYSFDRDEKKELCCCKSKNCRGFINEP